MKLKWKVVIITDVVGAAVTMYNFSHLNPTIHSL